MPLVTRKMFLSIATGGCLLPAAGETQGQQPPEAPVIDLAKPHTWKAAVDNLRIEQVRLAKALGAVALDEKREEYNRRLAITLLSELAKTGETYSMNLLIDNVATVMPRSMFEITPDSYHFMCFTWWYCLGQGNWATAEAIFKALDSPRKALELQRLGDVLINIMGPDMLLGKINQELVRLRSGESDYKKNIIEIKVRYFTPPVKQIQKQ